MRRDIAEQLAERPWYTSGSTLQVTGHVFCSIILHAVQSMSELFLFMVHS